MAHQKRPNIINPAKLDYVYANDVCIQCHSQGQPLTNPIASQYYDWPVGFRIGKNLSDFCKLEEHRLEVQSFTHFADETAHRKYSFDAPYTGPQGLLLSAESSYSLSTTAYLGARLRSGGELGEEIGVPCKTIGMCEFRYPGGGAMVEPSRAISLPI